LKTMWWTPPQRRERRLPFLPLQQRL